MRDKYLDMVLDPPWKTDVVSGKPSSPITDPVYSRMGRRSLEAYCERLREALMSAAPLPWAAGGQHFDHAKRWEDKAIEALNSHGSGT